MATCCSARSTAVPSTSMPASMRPGCTTVSSWTSAPAARRASRCRRAWTCTLLPLGRLRPARLPRRWHAAPARVGREKGPIGPHPGRRDAEPLTLPRSCGIAGHDRTEHPMKAAVVTDFHAPLELQELPVPEPGPGEVLVRIDYSGLCHTDIHAARGDWPVKPTPPFVPGHEGIGRIERLGAGVTARVRGRTAASA